jgi:hypothetical protein
MSAPVIESLYQAHCELLEHIQRGRADDAELAKWAREFAMMFRNLDLRLKAGEPLPQAWQRKP